MDTQDDFLSIVRNGLPKAGKPQKVLILGAGMAGLVAAYELMRAGHEPLILESRSRVGGRVRTLREPFTDGLYAEAGAMRLPRRHLLTMAYVEKFGLTVSPFTMGNPKAFCLLNGQKRRIAEYLADPSIFGFEVSAGERGLTAAALWEKALAPITGLLAAKGDAAWSEISEQYDRYSVREFFEGCGWSQEAIEMVGLLSGYEARMNSSFLDIIRAEIGHSFQEVVLIDGGTDRLPSAFLPALQRRLRFGAHAFALDQSDSSVTVHYRTEAGVFQAVGDYAIVTLPFSVLRHVDVIKPFSHGKRRAIRELDYDASAKIFLQSRRRFWEVDDGIFGGGSVTDLAIRNCYYPDHGRETGRGVLLASYTWGRDAERWSSLPDADRITEAIGEVSQIHPQIVEDFETGATKVWHEDPRSGGAFALFEPGQRSQLYDSIVAPEGRIHFAGEHASENHRWIQGAIESGLRAAREITVVSL
jgi:monoamine oxidase